MKRSVILVLTLFVLLAAFCGCGKRDVDDDGETVPDGTTETLPDSTAPEPEKEYSIVGKYVCDGDYFRDISMYDRPFMNFYDDGTCIMRVDFFGGIADINGSYTVEENKVDVKLDFNRSRFEGSGTTYMDDTYVFEITDNEKMTIDRSVYCVSESDPFIRTSETPDPVTVYDPDIVGKFVYTDNVYVKFFDGYECVICLGNDDTEKAWGNYSRIGDEVCVEIRYAPAIYGDNPSLYQEIEGYHIFEIKDADNLVIKNGFLDVKSGDAFVREK